MTGAKKSRIQKRLERRVGSKSRTIATLIAVVAGRRRKSKLASEQRRVIKVRKGETLTISVVSPSDRKVNQ